MMRQIFQGLLISGLLLLLGWSAPTFADTAGDSQTVGNAAVYLALLPAEMVRGRPVQHAENSMHGGVPKASREYILIALFDAKSGKRITGAHVSACVSEIGLLGEEGKLEPMEIAGTETSGNYFSMAGNGPFRIDVVLRLQGHSEVIKAEFDHWHR